MLYNRPAATGVDLEPDTVGALAREKEAREAWDRIYPRIDAMMA